LIPCESDEFEADEKIKKPESKTLEVAGDSDEKKSSKVTNHLF